MVKKVKRVVKKISKKAPKRVVKKVVKKGAEKAPTRATQLVPVARSSQALENLIESMTPATQKAYRELSAMISGLSERSIEVWYRIGERVGVIKGKRAIYGDAAVEQIADAVCEDPNKLYTAHRVTAAYTLPQLKDLIAKTAKHGTRITWTHISILASAIRAHKDGQRRRKEWERMLVEGKMTTKELEEELKRLGMRAPSKSGRKPSIPKNPLAACSQISKFKSTVERRMDGLDEALFDWIGDAPMEELTNPLHIRLTEGLADILALSKLCEQLKTKIGKALARTGKAVARHKEEKGEEPRRRHRPTPGVHETEQPERAPDEEIQEEEQIVEEGAAPRTPESIKERIARAKKANAAAKKG